MQLHLFLPCAAGVETYLAQEAKRITGLSDDDIHTFRAVVLLAAQWGDDYLLAVHSRLAQRELIELSYTPYRQEQDLYDAAANVAWDLWFTPKQRFKIDITA